MLEVLEGLFDLGELHVVLPERRGVFVGQVRAQQVAALPPAGLPEPVPPQADGEGLRGDRLAGGGHADVDQRPGPAGGLFGGAELEQQLITIPSLPMSAVRAPPLGFAMPSGAIRRIPVRVSTAERQFGAIQ